MLSSSELIAKIRAYHSNLNETLIQKAYILSKTAHGNQKRHSGDPYFSHPLAVAEILVDLKLDQNSIITALLHDVVEDTEVTLEEIEQGFGHEIAKLVDGITKLGRIESIPANEKVAENFRKLTLAMSDDVRVLLVKLADRLHNMRTLFYVPSKEKKLQKARESLDIYAPLAGRIGLNKIKDEMQELAFEIIDPESRNNIVEKLNELREKNKNLIEKITEDLGQILAVEGLECDISGREKKPYSILMKMKRRNIGFHNLNDIMAFRVVTSSVGDCYRVLGMINSRYSMIPKTFKDYISTPKENGYQSLHMAILGPFNKKIEIQIRDQRMHELADLGVAAHWRYKEKKYQHPQNSKYGQEQYRWITELVGLFKNSESASEALQQYKFSLHKNEIFCFTPNGDIFNLPIGATVVDFAYAVHSEIGNACVSCKVNGAIVPLRKKLENGDQVEIITSKNSKPSLNWLQFIITAKAKSAIKNFIKEEKSEEYTSLGKAILNKFFASKNLEISDKILEKVLQSFRRKTVEDLFIRVADGTIARHDVLKACYPDFEEEKIQKQQPNKSGNKVGHALPIEGLVAGMAMHYGGCCNPIPGDSIVGVIHTGTGVTIHTQSCHNLRNLSLAPQRVLDVCWKDEISYKGEEFYPSRIRVVVENKSGGLADISSIIAKKQVNISNIKIINRSSDYFELMVDIEVRNIDHLEEVLTSLRISNKVTEVTRVHQSYF